MKLQKIFTVAALIGAAYYSVAQNNNIAEEVVWVVGDEPIYKSQVEEQYSQMQYERVPIEGDPYCVIPEQLAINKLFLHQAEIDTIVVEESQVMQEVNARINYFIESLGTKEKVEEYFRKPLPEMRETLVEVMKNKYTVQRVQQE